MLKYTIQRILTFIPMLIAISLLSFIISINAPGDPVERLSKAAGNEGSVEQQSGASKKIKEELRRKLGLDLPIFYFSIGDIASSDTLYKVQDKYHQANLKALTHQSGNWKSEMGERCLRQTRQRTRHWLANYRRRPRHRRLRIRHQV